jgi:hypothetical protein
MNNEEERDEEGVSRRMYMSKGCIHMTTTSYSYFGVDFYLQLDEF